MNLFGELTDNVLANRLISPVYAVIVYLFLTKQISISWIPVSDITSPLETTLIFWAVFFYCSRFFQPDLDSTPNRPGMANFPLGKQLMNIKLMKGLYIRSIMYPINRIWYVFWEPYAILLTHRGISHWPILGVLSRVYYIKLFAIVACAASGTDTDILSPYFDPFTTLKFNNEFFSFVFPIYLSDITHSTVDFWDSFKKGSRFCSQGIPRGLISKIIKITV
jgi:uncharacterized metal-binding protein